MNAAIISLAVALLAINGCVTFWVARSAFLERRQQLAQTVLVWLLPLIGAVAIALFLFSNREHTQQRSHHVRNENDQWDGSDGLNHGHDDDYQ